MKMQKIDDSTEYLEARKDLGIGIQSLQKKDKEEKIERKEILGEWDQTPIRSRQHPFSSH